MVVYPYGDEIIARKQVGDVKLKGGVAVFPFACGLAVYIDAAVHIHAFKPQRCSSAVSGHGESAPVPAC